MSVAIYNITPGVDTRYATKVKKFKNLKASYRPAGEPILNKSSLPSLERVSHHVVPSHTGFKSLCNMVAIYNTQKYISLFKIIVCVSAIPTTAYLFLN